jgi:hypothetical protein
MCWPPCLSAVHHQYLLHSFVSVCCPPSVFLQFRCTSMLSTVRIRSAPLYLSAVVSICSVPCISVLSTVSIRSVPFYLHAIHRQCPLSSFLPQCCPPSISAQFLCASVLSTISVCSVPLCLNAVPRQYYSLSSILRRCCPLSVSV